MFRRQGQGVIDELSDGRCSRRNLTNDGIGADEGAFVRCGFWLSEALALGGGWTRPSTSSTITCRRPTTWV